MLDNQQPDFEVLSWRFDADSGIGTVTFDRPDSLNAMSSRLLNELKAAFERFESIDREHDGIAVRAVIIEGAGDRAFSAGADVEEIGGEPYFSTFRDGLFAVRDFSAPVIAKIDGYCVGGGLELALMCDFRIGSERSELGFPEIDLGIAPTGGGTMQRLPLLMGPSRAKELCMTGEFLSGTEAHDAGLLEEVHPADELDAAVSEYAEMLAGKPPLAVRVIKDTIDRSRELGLTQGTEYEYQASFPLLQSEDARRAKEAYDEDREVEWRGK